MKKFNTAVVLSVVFFTVFSVIAEETYNVSRKGRMIQLDGFLMDWNRDSTKTLSGSSLWTWDAVNTREGIAGYFRSKDTASCEKWIFRFMPCGTDSVKTMILVISGEYHQSFYRLILPDSSDRSITAEWLIPWSSIEVDSTGKYSIVLQANDTCNDTIGRIVFCGFRPIQKGKGSPLYLIFLFIPVTLILLLYKKQKDFVDSSIKQRNGR
jgi:hypothetical protein